MIYLLCVTCVCSFMVFEVLDSSDLPMGPGAIVAGTVEVPFDEIKRGFSRATLNLLVPGPAAHEEAWVAEPIVLVAVRPAPFVSQRTCRCPLPRASLADVPPAV